MEEIKKAFKLTVDNIADEPWCWDDIIVYAESHGAAKSKGLKYFDGAEIHVDRGYGVRDVEFTDLKARRIKNQDKILYDGEWVTQERKVQLDWQKERDEDARKIMEENPNGIAVVWAGVYNAYWGYNHNGYRADIENAGKYTTKEAFDIVKGSCWSRQETVQLLSIEKYNEGIQDKLDVLAIEYLKEVERLVTAKL